MLARFLPNAFTPLGTEGYGRSDTREALRRHFEIDPPHIVVACLYALSRQGSLSANVVEQALTKFNIDPEKIDPATA
ncbi:MAG TPA: hypothetical protein EYN38_00255 [Flavobacteriales bacterium]|nr:hypothetical protein [Flavobacteriales bacterium]